MTGSCPFYKSSQFNLIVGHIYSEVHDIEDMGNLGRKLKICPFYGSKSSLLDAEVVVLPYNILLHKATREAYGINLKDNVVIIDEAHNLLETLGSIQSVHVSYIQLTTSHFQLSEYFTKYGRKFSPKNVLYFRQILNFSKSLLNLFKKGEDDEASINNVHDFLCKINGQNINFLKIIEFVEKSRLLKKVQGYSKKLYNISSKSEKPAEKQGISNFLEHITKNKSAKNSKIIYESPPSVSVANISDSDAFSSTSAISGVFDLMRAFVTSTENGRVYLNISKIHKDSFIKYFVLYPSAQFDNIVRECRSVILAGGTMSPMEEFKQLFLESGSNLNRISTFSCGHVVEKGNVLPAVLTKINNSVLDFTLKNRNNPALLTDLGEILIRLSSIVPGGLVCFLPSYEYENQVLKYFERNDLLTKMSNHKKIFREPKESSKLDKVLGEFSSAIKNSKQDKTNGAFLFSVVGGKMSEGINFSDDLGRCVVMVGMPYPNKYSPELQQRISYLDKRYPKNESGQSAGAVFYENLCFKAVNQSIGRSIRHRNDYASIVLLDHRYAKNSAINCLPSWISDQMSVHNEAIQLEASLKNFFSRKCSS